MKQWFLSLAPRERVLVASAAVFAICALYYAVVWQPLHAGAAEFEQRIQRQRSLAVHVATMGAQADQLRAQSHGNFRGENKSLLAIINGTSRTAGLGDAIQRIQPNGRDEATVTIEGAGFGSLIRWLRQLQQKYGVTVSALHVGRGENKGRVEARMTLERTTG